MSHDDRRAAERRVIEALSVSARGPLKPKELARELDVPTHDYRRFKRLLTGMERAGKVVRVKGNRYAVAAKLDLVTGPISVTRDGDGFVRPEGGGDDVFVPASRIDTAMDGDRVVARVDRRPRGRSREGTVVRVIERARETVVGTYHLGRRFSYVTPLDVRLHRDVLVPRGDDGGADDGDVVVVRVASFGEGRVGPSGSVERVLGAMSDPGVDVLAVALGFGVSLDFPPEVTEAAERAARERSSAPGARTDRRDLLCFTIDPSDAKDHDDALSVQAIGGDGDGGDDVVEVGVHIADVSHFVPMGGQVDVEALARGTSVYLVDRTIPMLPSVLSNDVCSLRAHEDRFALSVFVRLDREGRILDRRYERTLIRCRDGLAYEDAQAVLDGAATISPEVDGALRMLDDRARHLRRQRRERGALDLDIPEAKVVLDERGVPVDIKRRERLSSHRLIEDYMILANEVVANDLEARGLGGLFRVHEPPTPEKVALLIERLAQFGLQVKKRKSLKPRDVQALVDAARGKPSEAVVSTLVLRSMKKARYDTENLGHFGLASSAYLHFTSPIRRYPDLVVHRVVSAVLVDGAPEPYPEPELLASIGERSSAREVAAEAAERASVALKKVEFMEQHLGDTFTGTISGVAAFGLFVTLDDYFVEGLVHIGALGDDYYHYRESQQALVGDRSRRRFVLGDAVEVQVVRVDKEARHIDFVMVRTR